MPARMLVGVNERPTGSTQRLAAWTWVAAAQIGINVAEVVGWRVIGKVALVMPLGTMTRMGTMTCAGSPLTRPTGKPLAGAALLIQTVPVAAMPPVAKWGLTWSWVRAGGA